MPTYEYVKSINRYRDAQTKVFVSRDTVLAYVEQIADAGSTASDVLSGLVADGTISPADFEAKMRAELKSSYIQEYLLGRGGRESMTQRDWGIVGRMLREEYKLLRNFSQDIRDGKLSDAQIRARSAMYFKTARTAYERANAEAYGLPTLPAYPKDGSTSCHGNCYCHWDIQPLATPRHFDCYWTLDPARENCKECLARGRAWYPLQVRDGVIQPYNPIGLFSERRQDDAYSFTQCASTHEHAGHSH